MYNEFTSKYKMTKKYIILLLNLVFFILSNEILAQNSFQEFIKLRIIDKKASELQEDNKIKQAIPLYKTLIKYTTFEYSASISLYECYSQLGKIKIAKRYLKKAASLGYIYEKNDSVLNTKLYNSYLKGRSKYINNIDTALQNKLVNIYTLDQLYRIKINSESDSKKIDSLFKIQLIIDKQNLKELYDIISRLKQWPSKKIIERHLRVRPEIIVIHSIEKDNLYFLNYALKAARSNLTDWFVPMDIEQNLSWRFQYEDDNGNFKKNGFNKLRKIKVTPKGEISFKDDNTFFEIYCLSKSLKDNRQTQISLFLVNTPNTRATLYTLNHLKNLLVELGVQPSRILISDKVRSFEDDGLGNYCIGYQAINQ